MSRALLLGTILSLSASAVAQAAELTCDACRSVFEYPSDYGNFVFNETFGDSPSLTIGEADLVRVSNSTGHWAMVDLNFMMSSYGTALTIVGFSQQIYLPNGMIEIRVQDPRGSMKAYSVYIDSEELLVGVDEPTPVPSQPAPPPAPPPEPPPTPPAPTPSTGVSYFGHGGIGASIYPIGYSPASAFGPFIPAFVIISTPNAH